VKRLVVRDRALILAISCQQVLNEIVGPEDVQGLTDFLTVLVVQGNLLTTQDALAQTEGEVAIELIALYKALGGGWEIAGTVP